MVRGRERERERWERERGERERGERERGERERGESERGGEREGGEREGRKRERGGGERGERERRERERGVREIEREGQRTRTQTLCCIQDLGCMYKRGAVNSLTVTVIMISLGKGLSKVYTGWRVVEGGQQQSKGQG